MSAIKSISAFQARNRFAALLKRVSTGETIRITVRGVPVAKLVPNDNSLDTDIAKLVRDIRALRKGTTLGKFKIRELIDEGRAF